MVGKSFGIHGTGIATSSPSDSPNGPSDYIRCRCNVAGNDHISHIAYDLARFGNPAQQEWTFTYLGNPPIMKHTRPNASVLIRFMELYGKRKKDKLGSIPCLGHSIPWRIHVNRTQVIALPGKPRNIHRAGPQFNVELHWVISSTRAYPVIGIERIQRTHADSVVSPHMDLHDTLHSDKSGDSTVFITIPGMPRMPIISRTCVDTKCSSQLRGGPEIHTFNR